MTLREKLGLLFPRNRAVSAAAGDYAQRLLSERSHYNDCQNVHELPEIFHYWSNRYLLPMFEPFGFNSPNDFFLKCIHRKCRDAGDDVVAIASVGAGNCDLETDIARSLLEGGLGNFRFDCIEINSRMLERATARVAGTDLEPRFRFLEEDFNAWRGAPRQYNVVMANQALHHVLELEHLFRSIRTGLAPDGDFLVSDMIGRNGHQRWPEARKIVEDFWRELPKDYRHNRLLQRQEDEFLDHDCSGEGFEGIRAQDILPLLVENFHFRTFVPYGNVVFVFVDRSFGHNFDAESQSDRDFIDRVHQADEAAILEGKIKPTSMIAAMSLESEGETQLRHPRLTPEFCVRSPD